MTHATGMKYVKPGVLPHMWCAGCGIGGMLGALLRAFEELDSGARALGGSMARRFLCVALPVGAFHLAEIRARATSSRTTVVGPASQLTSRSFPPPSD